MQPMPLVGAEVQRVNAAFQAVSLELAAAVALLRDLDLDVVGTPSCDRSVSAGMAHLRSGLSRLVTISDECVQTTSRHRGVIEGAAPAAEHTLTDEGDLL